MATDLVARGLAYQATLQSIEIANTVSPQVIITTNGTTFNPIVELVSGSTATVHWDVENGASYTGLSPNIDFGTTATRYIRMTVVKGFENALADIVTFNIGFNSTQDAGRYNIGNTYNHTSQSVSVIKYVNKMTNLRRFLAATPSLACALDFSGMSKLEYIECYGAAVTDVKLTGCISLIRLCMEDNDLATLDLNPVADYLYDLRASGNRSPLTLKPLTTPMAHLYHYCAQSEQVINHPTSVQLPVVEELWDWNSNQGGALFVRSSSLRSLNTHGNNWSSIDLANQFPNGRNGNFHGYNCQLTSVILTGCSGLTTIDLHNNLLNQAAVDAILNEVESWGTSNGTLNLAGNATPSSAGINDRAALTGRGWTITIVESATVPGQVIGLTSTGTTDTSITLSWTSPSGTPTDYIIEYKATVGSTWNTYGDGTGTNTSTVVTGLTANTSYDFRVSAVNASGYGTASTVYTISTSNSAPTVLWSDNFDRADATGISNVGNGWHTVSGTLGANIVNNNLVLTGSDSNYGVVTSTNTGTLPADYTVTMTIPAAPKGTYFGVVGRWYNGHGVRLLFAANETNLTVGDATAWAQSNVTVPTPTYPSNWSNNTITHTIGMKMTGTTIEVYLDGQLATTCTCIENATQTGTEVGFCGESHDRVRYLIEVTNNS